jgi:serine/threonine-protein kinase SRPK3
MYEMLTGDLLFHPTIGETWSKNEDHLAQIQEIIGPFHPHFIARSPKRKRYFQKDGKMKNFPRLNFYPLNLVLQIKNQIKKEEAD